MILDPQLSAERRFSHPKELDNFRFPGFYCQLGRKLNFTTVNLNVGFELLKIFNFATRKSCQVN